MKTRIFNIMAVTSAIFTAVPACTPEENKKEEVDFPEEQTLEIVAGGETTVTFTAEADWTLVSDKDWCKFKDNGIISSTASGAAGEADVTISVSADAMDFDANEAAINMTMKGETRRIISVVRPGKEHLVTMYTVGDGVNDEIQEVDNVTLVYNSTLRKLDAVNVGFTANFDWKVKCEPEGVLMEGLSGRADQIIVKEDMKKLSIEDRLLPYVLSEAYIVVLDNNGKEIRKFPVLYDGLGIDDIILKPAPSTVKFTYDGYLYAMGPNGNAPTENREYSFGVMAKDMKYSVVVVERDESNKEVILEGGPSWVNINDDRNGNVSFSVSDNPLTTKARTARLIVVQEDKEKEFTSVADYTKYFKSGKNAFMISQDKAVLTKGYEIVWAQTLANVSSKLVKFSEHPMFAGSKPGDKGYTRSPEDNTWVYEFNTGEIKGRLSFVPNGYPKGSYPHQYSRLTNNGFTVPERFVDQGSLANGTATVSISVADLEVKEPVIFGVDTFRPDADMDSDMAYASLIVIINPAD